MLEQTLTTEQEGGEASLEIYKVLETEGVLEQGGAPVHKAGRGTELGRLELGFVVTCKVERALVLASVVYHRA